MSVKEGNPNLQEHRKWTPGPWRIEKPEDELIAFSRHELSHGVFKASAKTVLGMKPSVIVWAESGFGGQFFTEIALVGSDDEANARLIAAAPDLFEALNAFVQTGDGHDDFRDEWPAARAAIAKALGDPRSPA